MKTFFTILLIIHVISGSVALLFGSITIFRKKGDKMHKKTGDFFRIGMLVSGCAGLIMSVLHPNFFLFIIGVFTLYMVLTGQRALHFMKTKQPVIPHFYDWFVGITMFLFSIVFWIYGSFLLYSGGSFGVVLLVFGFISSTMVYKDYSLLKNKNSTANSWLLLHIQRITGAYIASTTAFLVVNNTFLPAVVAWLLPTILVTPLIFIWVKKYKKNN